MIKKVIGIGNALVDALIPIKSEQILIDFELPKGASTIVSREKFLDILHEAEPFIEKKVAGGSAANTIHGIAALGMQTGFIGKIGEDVYGNFLESDMKERHITPFLLKGKHETGMAITFITPDSERTFAVYLGAALELDANDLFEEMFQGYDYFHIEGYLIQNYDLMRRAMFLAKQSGAKISLDLASYTMVEWHRAFLQEMVEKYVDIIFANEEEALAFTGKQPDDALLKLSEKSEIAVVKIGKKGALAFYQNQKIYEPAIDASPIDTTGAGDLYASGFLYGLGMGYNVHKCAKIGSLLAGNVIQYLGAKINDKDWEQIKQEIANTP
ncbi:MAG: adenosine kinase [Bacteroidales bacterium]|jgi:sugar/nucleoside kinase (ribokinase family)|nr:adenosine kinase [Bacteroidales bacterium]